MDTLKLAQVTAPDADVSALLQAHFDLMRSTSPEESCHVMEPTAVFQDAAVVITARDDTGLLGIGALKALDESHGELKSMHTRAAARGKGVGAAILKELMTKAADMRLTRLSLETGSTDEFTAARRLYEGHGFVECPPFGDYTLDPLSTFMTKTL